MVSEKVQKILARAGYGSRRELERWIIDGRITINGKTASIGDRAFSEDSILVDGKAVRLIEKQRVRVILYNKPQGEVCTRSDPEGRKTVFDSLPAMKGERWIAVGRLDVSTTGLLLFTNNGDLANKLMHPSSEIDREYMVRIHGVVDESMLKRLREGVLLDDGIAKFSDIVVGERIGTNGWYAVALTEGRNREVRRLWESQNVQVNRLKRVRFGPIFLPSFVRKGQWIELDEVSLNDLLASVKMFVPKKNKGMSLEEKQKRNRQVKRLRSGGSKKILNHN